MSFLELCKQVMKMSILAHLVHFFWSLISRNRIFRSNSDRMWKTIQESQKRIKHGGTAAESISAAGAGARKLLGPKFNMASYGKQGRLLDGRALFCRLVVKQNRYFTYLFRRCIS